eukprot:PITA_30815
MDVSFKYLGFWLKPNAYRKEDWNWLIAKIESRIAHWSYKWLSRAGRLTLIKAVLLAMPVYWAALTWVPKGILEKIKRICSRFLWAGSKEDFVLPWVAWDKVARPKEWGGWGIKKLYDFSLSLAAKSSWRLIKLENLWTRVVGRKYIDPIPLEDWIRSQNKKKKNVSMLESKGIFSLNQVEKVGHSSIWGQAWKSGEDLDLEAPWWNEWNAYIQELSRKNVRIKDESDQLVWAHADTGEYSPRNGYKFIMSRKGWEEPEWWARNLWKLKCPAKSRLFFWCILKMKIPTWDILQARYLQGPGRCTLCRMDYETINHLFLSCLVAKNVWAEAEKLMNKKIDWVGRNLNEAWDKWWQNYPEGNMRNLPLIICWGVWIARNRSIFEDKESQETTIAIQSIMIYSNILEPEKNKAPRQNRVEQIQEGIPWAYFDGASQNNRASAGIVFHTNTHQTYKASVGLGSGSNNYAELSALKLLLCWLIQRKIFMIQIFEDSLNVINWVNGQSMCINHILISLIDDIQVLKTSFNNFSLSHIYRDCNDTADKLSKEGLQQNLGNWKIVEEEHGQIHVLEIPPYI